MKKLLIHAKSKLDITEVVKKFKANGKIGLVTTIQYLDQIEKAQKLIPDAIIAGQVLGCDATKAINIKTCVDSYLYIGSGRFHPLEIARKTGKEVFIANPYTNEISKISKEEIENWEKKIKGKQIKFMAADTVGILISTKEGQNKMNAALKLKEELKDKKSYLLLFNTLQENELENYKNIDIFINTACPRIELKNVINMEELPKVK